jgi:hypothetical protein
VSDLIGFVFRKIMESNVEKRGTGGRESVARKL